MTKLQIEVTVPTGIIVYDLGTRHVECHVCSNRHYVDERPLEREGSFDQIFNGFLNQHAKCVLKYAEEQRQREEAINSTRGGPGDR